MHGIGPHEYDYLSWPYLSSGADMLEYTLQHLCFTGALDLHYWKVAAHPKNPRPVMRLFLARGRAVTSLSTAEAFALSLIPPDRPIHLGELRLRLKEQVKDEESFKFDLVRKDLKAAGLLRFTYWPSAEGRAARGRVSDRLSAFKRDLHDLIKQWRHGRATRSIMDAVQDAYVAIFSAIMIGAMLTNLVVRAQSTPIGVPGWIAGEQTATPAGSDPPAVFPS